VKLTVRQPLFEFSYRHSGAPTSNEFSGGTPGKYRLDMIE